MKKVENTDDNSPNQHRTSRRVLGGFLAVAAFLAGGFGVHAVKSDYEEKLTQAQALAQSAQIMPGVDHVRVTEDLTVGCRDNHGFIQPVAIYGEPTEETSPLAQLFGNQPNHFGNLQMFQTTDDLQKPETSTTIDTQNVRVIFDKTTGISWYGFRGDDPNFANLVDPFSPTATDTDNLVWIPLNQNNTNRDSSSDRVGASCIAITVNS